MKETWKLDKWPHFFHLLFPLKLFVTFIFLFENSQNSYSGGPPFGPSWSVKYLNFEQKLPIRTTHYTFLESRHPEVTKNSYYVFSPEGSQEKVSAYGLFWHMLNFCPTLVLCLWIEKIYCTNGSNLLSKPIAWSLTILKWFGRQSKVFERSISNDIKYLSLISITFSCSK